MHLDLNHATDNIVSKVPDNVIIGEPLVGLEVLGILDSETTKHFTFDEVRNEQGNVFLPHFLVKLGVFKSNRECRDIDKQRQKSSKFNKDPDQILWRNVDRPEFTNFKIGKKVFWLVVGE